MKQQSVPVTEINDEIITLAHNMIETMHTAEGVGLAGNQVGDSRQIVIIDTSVVKDAKVKYTNLIMINPEILEVSEELSDYKEGCLSVPDINDIVKRPKAIKIKYYDVSGKEFIIEDDDLFARVAQHEVDHLNGILFYERFSAMRKTLAKSKLKKIQKGIIVPTYPYIDPFNELVK